MVTETDTRGSGLVASVPPAQRPTDDEPDAYSQPAGAESESTVEDGTTAKLRKRALSITSSILRRFPYVAATLTVILLIAFALRIYGVDWDQGGAFHPDERAVSARVNALDFGQLLEPQTLFSTESRLNPAWFNYGSFYLYVVAAMEAVTSPFVEEGWSIFDLQRNGRRANAVFDTLTVLLVFLITRRLFSVPSALLAALLAALSVIAIQNAHYATVDSLTTTLVTGTVYTSIRYVGTGSRLDAVLSGVLLGLAIATKFAAAPVAAAVAAAHVFRVWDPRNQDELVRLEMAQLLQLAKGLMLSGVATFVALALAQPYMFIDFGTWISDVVYQSRMVRRSVDLPYTRQYIDTAVIWYQVRQFSTYGVGIFAAAAVWFGLAWGVIRSVAIRDRAALVALAFLIPYLLIVVTFDVKFTRYMLPAAPLLMVFAAGALGWCGCKALGMRNPAWLFAVGAVALVVVLGTAHYAVAFTNVFAGKHPAHQASDWLENNATVGATVIQEHWEEGIPGRPNFVRIHDRLPFYEADNESKWTGITTELASSDYFVLYSNRLSATLPRLPTRYPISTRFYEMLFSGGLGFDLQFVAHRFPSFAGVTYRDDPYARVPFGYPQRGGGDLLTIDWYGWADESHTVYDHPQTLIFENTGRLSPTDLYELLDVEGLSDLRAESLSPEVGLMLTDEDRAVQESGGTWNEVYWLRNLPNSAAWLVWLAAVQLIALVTLPLSYAIFRPLADRGYMFAKVLGLLLVGTAAWLLASYRILGFGVWSIALVMAVLAAISAALYWRMRTEIHAYVRANIRSIITVEALFLIAFFGFLLIRLANPDLWHIWRGGEKPMDFAYLNAVTRSTFMPPYDPWYAGGYLNYYYYGQFLVATLIKLTGIIPTVAYNLAVPLIFALTAGAAYSLVYNLVSAAKRAFGSPKIGLSPIAFGLLGAVMVAVAANIDGLVQLVQLGWGTLVNDAPFWDFDYWRSSRMLEPGTGGNEITEFPFFTFMYADLHAHMIAMPVAMLALALAITAALRVGMPRNLRFEGYATVALLGITVGALRLINSWDFPTQLVFAIGLVGLAEVFLGHAGFYSRLISATIKSVAVVTIGYFVFLPFHSNFELFSDGIQLSEFQTPLWRYVLIHALFLFAIFSWVVVEWRRGAFGFASIARATGTVPRVSIWLPLCVGAAVGALAVVLVALFAEYLTAMLAVAGAAALAVTAALAYGARHPAHRYIAVVAAIAALALLLTAAVDVITVKNDIGRQNTIFKFYIQAWWLFAVASAFAMWRLWDLGYLSFNRVKIGGKVWIIAGTVLLIGCLVYPVMATRVKMAERFEHIGMGIDGEAYMDAATYRKAQVDVDLSDDKAGIQWLRDTVQGSPTIVEGVWDLYSWTQRVSIYTGLPTVMGWDWHQTQQRFDYSWDIVTRKNDVKDFYATSDPSEAVEFLDKYGVRYVYVGKLERDIYWDNGIAKFDEMEPLGLFKVFSQGPVSIYRYD